MSALLSPSSSLRASLLSLPRELLRQIVAEVHAQDLVFGRLRQVQPNRSRYGAWPAKARRATSPFELADVEVQWSYWYGKGVSALSYVNKQLRQLSLPLLVETVTPHQLEKPFAIYALPYSPIARMIKHLDLVLAERTETWSAAAAMHLLPELEHLSISVELAQDMAHKRVSDESQSEHAAYARQAFARRSPHIRELSLFGTSWTTFGSVLSSFTTIETLKVLSIALLGSDPLTASRLREADVLGLCSLRLSDLRLASTLEDDDDPDVQVPTVNPTWIARLHMPSLRSFGYSGQASGQMTTRRSSLSSCRICADFRSPA
ncbi:hypothetical protein Rhopal_004324-T1 [Rhodotorula paludigena]|uniref:F-box domain-containing protein n=1 Tax=Rhodotorula paludigena TaxID=86838 RepID=A0AAV5GP58_9BASI|nr:hypothetical protein Rhopal_004324-T1 [Rhodotorula paludigena]